MRIEVEQEDFVIQHSNDSEIYCDCCGHLTRPTMRINIPSVDHFSSDNCVYSVMHQRIDMCQRCFTFLSENISEALKAE